MRILPNLPDWLNPVFVKDIRHIIQQTAFRRLNVLLILATGLLALKNWSGFSCRATLTLCNFVLFLQTMSMIIYWAKENVLEQLAPQKITSLSTFRILTGRLSALLLSLVIIELCCLIPGSIIRPELFLRSNTFRLLAFNLLLFLTWTSFFAFITMQDPYRKASKIRTGTIGFIATLCYLYKILPLTFDQPLLQRGETWLLLAFLFAFFVLFWYAKFAAPQANWMLPIRAGGLLIFFLFYALAHMFLGQGSARPFVSVLCGIFCVIQILLLVADPLLPPKRMALDAPQNLIEKGIWYFCGTGALGAWLYGIPVLLVITHIFAWNPFFIIALAYLIIYAALTMWLRIAFPGFLAKKGILLFTGISALATTVDFLLVSLADSFLFISPLSVLLMLLLIIITNFSALLVLAIAALFTQDFSPIQEAIAQNADKIQQPLHNASTILAIIAAGCAMITIAALIIFNKKRNL